MSRSGRPFVVLLIVVALLGGVAVVVLLRTQDGPARRTVDGRLAPAAS